MQPIPLAVAEAAPPEDPPGVILLLTWLYVHYHCHCVCVQDALIQEDGVSSYEMQLDSDKHHESFSTVSSGISLKNTEPQKRDHIIDVTIHEGDEDEEV